MRISDWSSDVFSSYLPLFVEAYFRDQRLGVGTAFPWLLPDTSLALITNWHVAAGRNHETDACLHPMAGVPDHLRVRVPQNERSDAPYIVSVATMDRSEEQTSELQSLMRISYAVFCLK